MKIKKLQIQFMQKCGNEALTTLALSPLMNLLNSESKKKITYRYLFYTRRIEREQGARIV